MSNEQDVKENASSEVDTLKAGLEEVKAHFNQARGSVDADIAAISATKARFDNIEKNLTETSAKVQAAQADLSAKTAALTSSYDNVRGLVSDFEKLKTDAEDALKNVHGDIKEITDTKTDFVTAKNDAIAEHTALQAQLEELQPEIDAIHKHHESITKIQKLLMEDTKDKDGNITIECPASAIQSLQKKVAELFEGIQSDRQTTANQFEELKTKLEAEIRSLLPGAGAAGLASAYFDAKGRYGSTPFRPDAEASDFFNAFARIWHSLKSLSFLCYYALFIAPLVVIYWTFKDIQIQDLTPGIFLFRVLISTPMAIVSWFGFSSIRLNRRLYEEYNHKQRVMELFYSFEGIIAKDGKEDQKQELLEIMLKVVDHRPSLVMATYDAGPEGIFSRFWGTRTSELPSNEG